MTQMLRPHNLALAVLAICIGSLAFAYAAQYGFDLQPCILCLYQRVPFAVAGALAVLVLVLRGRFAVPLFGLAGAAFLVGAGIAGYHFGVEQHWWAGTEGCTGALDTSLSIEDLKAQLMATPLKRCDEVTWALFGISITAYNLLWSLVLGLGTLYAARQLSKEPSR